MPEIVKPGDSLGVSEEFVAGPGTFEENGKIYSMFYGVAERDSQERKISVKGRKEVRPLKEGDLVYGVVQQLYEAMTLVRFTPVVQGNEVPSGGDSAFIRISELQNGYVERLRDCVRTGDFLKARVLSISPLATYLTMKERDLGVVRALCSMCRAEMKPAQGGGLFVCPSCGSREERKTPLSGDASGEDSYQREGGNARGREGGFRERRGGFGGRREERGGRSERGGGYGSRGGSREGGRSSGNSGFNNRGARNGS